MKIPYPIPKKKEQRECKHEHVSYTGKMPCTGLYRCMRCGALIMESVYVSSTLRILQDKFVCLFESMRFVP